MDTIKEILFKIIIMLKESSRNSQAEWLEERLHGMNSDESQIKAIKDVKSIIAGMGSLSDLYLEVQSNITTDKEKYNIAYRNLVNELDSEITKLLSK